MSIFRCYALDVCGRIVGGENIEGDSLAGIMEPAWQFVTSMPAVFQASGLEVWQGSTKLFSTAPHVFLDSLAGYQARAA